MTLKNQLKTVNIDPLILNQTTAQQTTALFYQIYRSFDLLFDDEERFNLSSLPTELPATIFQIFNPASMLTAMQVQGCWYSPYKSDKGLRRILMRKVRKRKEARRPLIHNLTIDHQ